MSTPTPVITTFASNVTPSGTNSSALTWLQKHERIVIVFLVLLAATWLGQKFLDVRADRDKQAAIVAVQQLNEQKTQNAQLATQVTQLNTQYNNLNAQLSAENAQLSAAMQNRVTVLHDQQQTDKAMPLPDLGSRWAALAAIAPADINASTAGITVTDTGARQTVEQLEQVPVLQQNLKDEQTVADNEKQEVVKANVLIGDLSTQVTGLNKTVTEEGTACKAQIASVKADANKSKSKWFRVGFGLGFVAGLITGHHV